MCVLWCADLAVQGKSFWQKGCEEKNRRSNYLKRHQLWKRFFTLSYLCCNGWVVVFHILALAFKCKYTYDCWKNFKSVLKEYSGYQTLFFLSFFPLLILDFLGRWTLNIGQNFCLQPSISTKMERGLVLGVKFPTRWVFLKHLKPEYDLYFDF